MRCDVVHFGVGPPILSVADLKNVRWDLRRGHHHRGGIKLGRKKKAKTSLMGIPFSRSHKYDMAKVLVSSDLDGIVQ